MIICGHHVGATASLVLDLNQAVDDLAFLQNHSLIGETMLLKPLNTLGSFIISPCETCNAIGPTKHAPMCVLM